MEWTADIVSGDALHAALFVYRNHFENGRKMFEEKIKEQDAALRALTLQILATEREINNTFEYFSGAAIENLPYESEEGKLRYEELSRMQEERLARQGKSMAEDVDVELDDDSDTQSDDEDTNEDTDDSDDDSES